MTTNHADISNKVNLVTNIANKLRGPYTPEKYGSVIIPMAILRRFDCVLEEKNHEIRRVLNKLKAVENGKILEEAVNKQCGVPFYNEKCVTFEQLVGDSDNITSNFLEYIGAFSPSIARIVQGLKFREEVEFMAKKGLLFQVVKAFSEVDFHPDTTDPLSMGYIFEDIIRKYKANAEAGDHYTPREIIELCVSLMTAENIEHLKSEGKIIRVYDGCCGTGGMLTVTKRKLVDDGIAKSNYVRLFGQDFNPEAYAVCCAEMMFLGESPENIYENNTLTEDRFTGQRFDLLITNPPFGVEWKPEKDFVEKETSKPNNRFVAGLPRINDGQLLFIQNMIAKADDHARIAIIFNGSPLFSGDAGSGESEVRRYCLENNLLEAIIALPDQMFYNTGINTYIWILSKTKSRRRDGKVQLINATDLWEEMKPKSLGNKRKRISDDNRKDILRVYQAFEENERSKIFDIKDFGYNKVVVERPMRDADGNLILKKGQKQPDVSLRDTENVPLKQDIQDYFAKEVLPFVPDAWVDESKTKIGYEIPLTRYFYKYTPPQRSEEILKNVLALEASIATRLGDILHE